MFTLLWVVGSMAGCRGPCGDTTVGVVETISVTPDEFLDADVDADGQWDTAECVAVCDARTSMAVSDCSVGEYYPDTGRYDIVCTGTMVSTCSIE